MSDFAGVFAAEAVTTIEGLTGRPARVVLNGREEVSSVSGISPPAALIPIVYSGAVTGRGAVILPASLATALGEMMFGGAGDERETMGREDLDAVREIVSNIVGPMSTVLGAQNELPKLRIKTEEGEFIPQNGEVNLDPYRRVYYFTLTMGATCSFLVLAVDASLAGALDRCGKSDAILFPGSRSGAGGGAPDRETVALGDEELANIALLMDVKLPVRVRIGRKKMLLKEVLEMDIGSIIELNQLADDPLEILVGETVIAQGEVVVVDGNFGVRITSIHKGRDRLNTLKG